jgi:hypothetical protein
MVGGIRRLPPVTPADAGQNQQAALLSNGSIPIYPTTGIE